MALPPEILAAIERGWSIIPVGRDKKPLLPGWKGFQTVRAPREEVESWQRQLHPPSYAVITGALSGLIVLDFDGAAGAETLRCLGLSPHVQTGSGGHHVYFVHPGWPVPTVNGKSRRALGERYPGLDIRADGGYAVFYGSNESGAYKWLREPVPDSLDVLPPELREMLGLAHPPETLEPTRASSSTLAERVSVEVLLRRALEQAPSGRNDAGLWLACQLRDAGYSESEAEAPTREYVARVSPVSAHGAVEPYTESEALASLRQAYSRPPREPWRTVHEQQSPDLSVLDGLVERAKASSTVFDAPGVIEALAWLFAKEPARYDDLRRRLRKVDVGTRAFEPRVRQAARRFLRAPNGIDENAFDKPSEVAGEKFGAFTHWRSLQGDYGIACARSFRFTFDKNGVESSVRIANFAARVIEETALDDGADVMRFYTIDGMLYTGAQLPACRVLVAKFQIMNWPTEIWGLGPSIAAGLGAKDHLRASIESFSGTSAPRRTVFVHLGWRRLPEKNWIFLHAGGAVGANDLDVDLEAELQRFVLPPATADACEAMRLSLIILELGDPRVTFPLWATIWRAPLCEWLPFLLVLWLLGETGTLKSTLAALILSHFGGPFDKDSLPASWLDTENRLEQKLFLAKDCLIVVDDFCPEKHTGSAQELERRASRVIRAVGNRQARGRLRSDLSARKSYIPRGLVISTAEQLPNLAVSALARLLPIPFEKGAIDMAKLTQLQQKAQILPNAIRAYLEHLAPQGDGLKEVLRSRFEELRGKARIEGHDRLPEAVAHMFIGLEMGIAFAVEVGAINEERARELIAKGWEVFMGLAQDHAKLLQEERPTRIFIRALEEALFGGRVWLADRTTGRVASGAMGQGSTKIGWLDGEGIYLLPDTAYALAADRLRHRGGIAIGERALRSMLLKDGVLVRSDEERLTTKKRCEGSSTSVLWLRRDALGDIPEPSARKAHCHQCGTDIADDAAAKCSACGWLACPNCGACKPDCEKVVS